MKMNVAQKLISNHLLSGEMVPGTEIGIRIDQTLAPDSSGTMIMLELEALGLQRVLDNLHLELPAGAVTVLNTTKDEQYAARHRLSQRQVEMVLAGGLISQVRNAG